MQARWPSYGSASFHCGRMVTTGPARAVVMGHEVACHHCRSTGRPLAQGLLTQFGAIGLSLASAWTGATSNIFMQGRCGWTQVGFSAPLQPHPRSPAHHWADPDGQGRLRPPRGRCPVAADERQGGSRPPSFCSLRWLERNDIDLTSQAMQYYKVQRWITEHQHKEGSYIYLAPFIFW